MKRPLNALLVLLGTLAACRSAPPDRPRTPDADRRPDATATVSPQEEPDTTPPADVSHGEAPIGGPAAEPAPVLARLAPAERTRLHRVRMEMTHTTVTIAPGIRYAAWTFGGAVPGPALRVRQGDTVAFTLINRANIPHSMDFHAAELAPSKYYVNVMPNDSLQYSFVARVPGAFMYHCGTAPVAMHIANGMYGALIVDPERPRPAAKEFVLVQSEFYLGRNTGPEAARILDWEKLLSQSPDHVVFNGRAGQYATHPIDVRPGELIRMYVVNAGPNRTSAFHVVGGIFERVFEGGSQTNPLVGVQTVDVPVGGGSIFEVRLREAGDYPFVTHAFADATKGGVGVLRALPAGATAGGPAASH
jgi:nitrite reductase (NO-forming)